MESIVLNNSIDFFSERGNWDFPKQRIQWQNILMIKRIIQIRNLLCKSLECYHWANKIQVTERIVVWPQIQASVIYQIRWIHQISIPFMEKSILSQQLPWTNGRTCFFYFGKWNFHFTICTFDQDSCITSCAIVREISDNDRFKIYVRNL